MTMTRAIKSKNTKETIRDVTIEMINKDGYENVTIRKICKKAGVGIGTFYHHYNSLDDIFLHYYLNLDDITKIAEERVDPNKPPEEQFISYFVNFADYLESSGYGEIAYAYFYTIQLKEKKKPESYRKRLFFKMIVNFVEREQEKGTFINSISAADICNIVQATFRGIIIDWCCSNGSFNLVERIEFSIRTVTKTFIVNK